MGRPGLQEDESYQINSTREMQLSDSNTHNYFFFKCINSSGGRAAASIIAPCQRVDGSDKINLIQTKMWSTKATV